MSATRSPRSARRGGLSLRIAVIGCGSIGSRHLRNLAYVGERDVLAYDSDIAAAEHAAKPYGYRAAGNLSDIWAFQPEAVLVCSPTDSHVRIAMEAARRSSHLFIEKPLSHALDHLADLRREVRGRRLISMVGCNMRFHFGPATIHKWLSDGKLGEVVSARFHTGSYLPSWRPNQDYRKSYSAGPAGGAILDCIHELDLALWMVGPARMTGASVRKATAIGLDVDGSAEILLDHDNGAVGSVHLDFVQRNYSRHIEIVGSQGAAQWDFTRRTATLYGPTGTVSETVSEPTGSTPDDMYVAEIREFLNAVKERRQAPNPIEEATRTLRIALAAKNIDRRSMHVVGIIQARMGSSRLPGKVLADLMGKPMLAHVIEGARTSKLVRRFVVATTTNRDDDAIEAYCRQVGVACFRGSENDVLDRYFQAARLEGADAVVRLTADNPLLMGEIIDDVVDAFLSQACDYASNVLEPTFPDGTDTEVFTFAALARSHKEATLPSDREHVSTYIRKGTTGFRTLSIKHVEDVSALRWTVDEPADLDFARQVMKAFHRRPTFQALLDFLGKNPRIADLNRSHQRNEGYHKSLLTDQKP